MIQTHGLSHISLKVRDPERSMKFYAGLFGAKEYYRDETSIQAIFPGKHDVLAFEKDEETAGQEGGIAHFGFRLIRPENLELLATEAEKAGGKILRKGEFAPGFPFVYVTDPDGYEVEIWFE